MRSLLFALPLALSVAACSQPTEVAGSVYIADGTPEAIGILALLDADVSDRTFLDDVVGLEKRAVSHLLAFRDGNDRMRGTADDQSFTSMTDVQDVRFVGYHAIDTLLEWSFALGFVPGSIPTDIVVDGVVFDALEASTSLAYITDAPVDLLIATGIDRRAVTGLIEARPFPHLWSVGSAWFVGPTALQTLRQTSMLQDVAITDMRFANDLRAELVDLYTEHGDALQEDGAVPLATALAAVHVRRVEMITEVDPYGYTPEEAAVYTHPGVVFPDAKRTWYGAYAWETGVPLSLYWFSDN